MNSQRFVRAGRIGAIYDIAVTAGFATPWTAALLITILRKVHDSLGLPGQALPEFDTTHLLYVILFGIVVTMWAVVRVMRPIPLLITADTVGRAAFSLSFLWALSQGQSAVVLAFLALELAFLVYQALGVRAALRADRDSGRLRRVDTDAAVNTH